MADLEYPGAKIFYACLFATEIKTFAVTKDLEINIVKDIFNRLPVFHPFHQVIPECVGITDPESGCFMVLIHRKRIVLVKLKCQDPAELPFINFMILQGTTSVHHPGYETNSTVFSKRG